MLLNTARASLVDWGGEDIVAVNPKCSDVGDPPSRAPWHAKRQGMMCFHAVELMVQKPAGNSHIPKSTHATACDRRRARKTLRNMGSTGAPWQEAKEDVCNIPEHSVGTR
jgi:hypothetical protein